MDGNEHQREAHSGPSMWMRAAGCCLQGTTPQSNGQNSEVYLKFGLMLLPTVSPRWPRLDCPGHLLLLGLGRQFKTGLPVRAGQGPD
jgi:hypothetical protein